jgi:RNA polymerase sigma-70 factor (ECF subfamily)
MPGSMTDRQTSPAPWNLPEVSDEDLVERVRQGEIANFELLMRRHNQRLFRTVRSIVGNDPEAEDVVQDAYVRAYSHLGQFEGRARFSTWLTKIAVHEARARLRRQRRFTPLTGNDGTTGDPASRIEPAASSAAAPLDNPEQAASARELRAVLTAAVDALPESLRSVFVLRDIEGLSTAEAAECLEISPVNVKVRLHRARTALQADIDRRLGSAVRQLYAFAGERCDRTVRGVLARIAALPANRIEQNR